MLRPFSRFCVRIGAVPPSIIKSLSYEEQLIKLVKFLKEQVVPAINNNANAIEELQTAMIELENYVNTYFDNLDVQEEIDNKLDDMVEQGTLQEIIADYLNSKAIFVFDTVADMVSSTNLIDGSYAKTLGYHEKSDEGSALYLIREITNDDVIDNMQIISLNRDDLIAEFINEDGIIRPEQFGAYGDDTHDDSTILNTIITIAKNKDYKIVGNKTYKTTAPIVIVGDKIDITLQEIDYTGVENAIYVKGNNNHINVNSITSLGNGVYLACDIDTLNYRNIFNINTINCAKHGICLYSDSWGIFENDFTFKQINVSDTDYYGIYLYSEKLTEKTSYVNQNVFNGGRIDGAKYAVYADASQGQINELLCYGISGEGCLNGIYLNTVTDSSFEDWRLEELTNYEGKLYMKLVGGSGNNNFRFNRYVPIELIDRSELTNGENRVNIIYSNIRDTRQGVLVGSIMKFYGDKVINIVSPNLSRSKNVGDDYALGTNEVVFFFNTLSTPVSTTPTIKLNGMYHTNGINTFYVYKRSAYTSVTVQLYDESNSVEITRNGLNQVMIIGGLLLVQ